MISFYKLHSIIHWPQREWAVLKLLDSYLTAKGKLNFRIVDFGCGIGLLADSLIKDTNVSYVGIDEDERVIMYANKRYSATSKSVNFICYHSIVDMIDINSQDIVILNGVVHHLSDIQLGEIFEEIKNAGAIIICDHIKVSISWSFLHSYFLQKLDKGKYIRGLDDFDKINGFVNKKQILFNIKLSGINLWPYFASLYLNVKNN